MRIVVECEKCGARGEAHRLGWGWTGRIEHICDTPETRAVEGPREKGKVHFLEGRA